MIRKTSRPFRILLVVTATILFGYLGFRVAISHKLATEVGRWQDAGMPVVLADLFPVDGTGYEAATDNGASLFRDAIATMSVADFTGSDTEFIKQLHDDPVAGPASPEALKQAQVYLADREAGIDAVMLAMAKPELRFDVNWQASLSGMSERNHLLGLIHWNRVLRTRLYVAMANNRPHDAIADLERAIHMTDALTQEPRLDAYFVRLAILRSVAAAASRVANRAALSPATSRRLAVAFSDRLEATDLAMAINGERCLSSARYLVPAGRTDALCRDAKGISPLLTLPGFGDLMDLRLLRFYSVVREYEVAAQQFGINRLNETHYPHDFQLPPLQVLHREQAEFTAAMELADYGLSLSAMVAEGSQPKTLADLSRKDEMPTFIDPCADGEDTYVLLANDHEYRIYSVGRNGIDEGGTEQYHVDGLREFRGGDIAFIRRLRPHEFAEPK